jgi:hypothetical protein
MPFERAPEQHGGAGRVAMRAARSRTISSITPKLARSSAVRRSSAALRATVSGVRSRKRIDAQPPAR